MSPLPHSLTVLLLATTMAQAELPPELAASLTADFAERDKLPQTPTPERVWYQKGKLDSWGPKPADYPAVKVPANADAVTWKRERVAAVARKYIGLAYQHHHIPAWTPPWPDKQGQPQQAGLDCSNFTSWVYNYGLGVRFTSHVEQQADGPTAPGRKLEPGEPLAVGDLLFIQNEAKTQVTHVVIYLDDQHVIDSHAQSVQVRPFKGWYKRAYSHARRVVE